MNKTRPKQIIFRATDEEFNKIKANIEMKLKIVQTSYLSLAIGKGLFFGLDK